MDIAVKGVIAMNKLKVALSIKIVPAANGLIGVQTLLDGKPYSKQGAVIFDFDDNGYRVVNVDGKPAVIINGDLNENGVMQMREV